MAKLSNIYNNKDLTRYENIIQNDNDANSESIDDSNEKVMDGNENVQEKVDPSILSKRITRKIYILNSERLKSSKGIHKIEKIYEEFTFHGKGHEVEDLDRVLKKLEYWAFRLFPKLDFDDFLIKCEYLGNKKDLQNHLKKCRIGMIIPDNVYQIDINEENQAIFETEKQLISDEAANHNFQKLFDESRHINSQN